MYFGKVSFDILADVLKNLNKQNKSKLENVSCFRGDVKRNRIVKRVFFICKKLGLNVRVGYHALEILGRFMERFFEDQVRRQKRRSSQGGLCGQKEIFEDNPQPVKDELLLFMFTCVQIASKLDMNSNVVNYNTAVSYFYGVGKPYSKKKLLETEILVLKTLAFNLNMASPLTYVETLLEVLGHNDPNVHVEQIHGLCLIVLQYVYLQRETIYNSLLVSATGCLKPSQEQRTKFVSVTEDFMLLGVAVIAVAAFIYQVSPWEKVVEELSGITGISDQSITEFAYIAIHDINST